MQILTKTYIPKNILELIQNLTQIETLTEEDFPTIDKVINKIAVEFKAGNISKEDISALNATFGEEFLNETIQGFGLRKPYGYAGDFSMIDQIYTLKESDNPKYKIWDKYFHSQSAPIAVRNRKEYFKKILIEKLSKQTSLSLLNVASGPARDLFELYSGLEKNQNVTTTCVEMDKDAIAFAKNLNGKFLDQITFVQSNIFRHKESLKYDVIWSAGLFDYFNDKAFVMILSRFREWLKPGGEIIIGNFNEANNPSRNYMEIFGEWYLHHRRDEQLIDLAEQAGFEKRAISVGKEEENVNLFLHLKSLFNE